MHSQASVLFSGSCCSPALHKVPRGPLTCQATAWSHCPPSGHLPRLSFGLLLPETLPAQQLQGPGEAGTQQQLYWNRVMALSSGKARWSGPVYAARAKAAEHSLGMGMDTAGITSCGAWEGKAVQTNRAVRDDVSLYRGDKWLEQCGIPGILSSVGWNMVLITGRLWDHPRCGPGTEGPGSTTPAGPFPPRTRPKSVEFLSAQFELPFPYWTIGKALKGQRSPCSETRACAAGTHLNHARCSALPKAAAPPAATSHDSPSRPSAREPRAPLSRPLLSPHSPTGFMAAARACCPRRKRSPDGAAAAPTAAPGGGGPAAPRPPRPQEGKGSTARSCCC